MDKFSFLLSYFSFVLNEKKKIDKFITYPGYSAILLLPSFNHPDYKFKLSRVNRTNEEDRKPTPFALFYFFFLLTATRVFIINFPIHVKLIAQKKKKNCIDASVVVSQSVDWATQTRVDLDGWDGWDGRTDDWCNRDRPEDKSKISSKADATFPFTGEGRQDPRSR